MGIFYKYFSFKLHNTDFITMQPPYSVLTDLNLKSICRIFTSGLELQHRHFSSKCLFFSFFVTLFFVLLLIFVLLCFWDLLSLCCPDKSWTHGLKQSSHFIVFGLLLQLLRLLKPSSKAAIKQSKSSTISWTTLKLEEFH